MKMFQAWPPRRPCAWLRSWHPRPPRQRAGAAARFRQGERGHRLVLAIHGERPGPHPAGANRHVRSSAPASSSGRCRSPEQLVISDGAKVYQYDPDLLQVTERKVDAPSAPRPPRSCSARARGAVVRGVGAAVQGRPGLAARQAAQRRRRFSRVDIGLKDNLPARVELLDSFGQTTRVDLSGITPNPSIGAKNSSSPGRGCGQM